MNIRNIIAAFLSLFLCAQISNAQSNIFKGDFEANAKLISDYRFRGVSRTSNDFAVQGGVDFYSDTEKYLFSKKLYANDLIMLSSGGHGFKILQDIEMIEVKQGPYFLSEDKVKFDKTNENKIKFK